MIPRGFAAAAAALMLAACAFVDQFDARVSDSNVRSQNAMNAETLVNILRASQYQTMNFVAITQLTGGMSETLTTGLPTVTFGPLQTAAQHQFPISNSVSSGVTGGFQSNPLVSTNFQSAMLSPVSPRTVALLASSHPREPALYMSIEAITLSHHDFVVRYVNDPSRKDDSAICNDIEETPTEERLSSFETHCNYSAFLKVFEDLLFSGLTSELLPEPKASPKPGTKNTDTTTPQTPQQAPGHICFDVSQAYSGFDAQPRCGSSKPAAGPPANVGAKNAKGGGKGKAPSAGGGPDAPSINVDDKNAKAAAKDKAPPAGGIPSSPAGADSQKLTIRGVGTYDLSIVFRSPIAIFHFLGELYGQEAGGDYSYRLADTKKLLAPGEPFLQIMAGNGSQCYSSTFYNGQLYCVPSGSVNTALLFTILQELRNLSIQSSDLNSAFTVRVTN